MSLVRVSGVLNEGWYGGSIGDTLFNLGMRYECHRPWIGDLVGCWGLALVQSV